MSFKTGNKGQRYEVRCKDAFGKERIVGWADDPKNLVESVELHPSFHSPEIIDRKKVSND